MTSEVILGRNLCAIDALEERISQVICQLPLRDPDGGYLIGDEALRATALTAGTGAKALWKLGCAARAEIVRRISERTKDSAVIAREIAREAAEEGISVRTLRRDASIGQTFGPLFAEPDTAPDLNPSFYSIALRNPDPPAALALAAQRKDQNPLYSTSDFEADLARARMSDPERGYGLASTGRCGLVYLWPFWDEGVLEATERCIELPLGRWLLPDAIMLLRTPPRAIDLGCRIMQTHDLHYQQCVILPTAPYRDGCAWHEHELLLIATRGQLRLPNGLPGTWRDRVEHSAELHFPFASPRLVVYPRHGMALGESWVRPEELP